MGRASGQSRAAAGGTVANLSTARRDDATALDVERDALWFSHRDDLLRASSLLRCLPELSDNEREQLCLTMERVGYSVGLEGPWRVFETPRGVRLAYISWWDESDDEGSAFRCHELEDEFDGLLIDGLPEPRYLGRLVRELAGEYAGHPWHETDPGFSPGEPASNALTG